MSLARSFERRRVARLQRQGRRAAAKVRWPKGFKGTIMWCPLCYAEIHRIAEGETCLPGEQQRITCAHRAVCKRGQSMAV